MGILGATVFRDRLCGMGKRFLVQIALIKEVKFHSLAAFRHTMTSKILFRDIVSAVKLFLNFHPDTLPLILSLENHCSIPQQEIMAEQLVQILGKSLYIPKEESLNGPLPSPLE